MKVARRSVALSKFQKVQVTFNQLGFSELSEYAGVHAVKNELLVLNKFIFFEDSNFYNLSSL